jgi:hypothetical protein
MPRVTLHSIRPMSCVSDLHLPRLQEEQVISSLEAISAWYTKNSHGSTKLFPRHQREQTQGIKYYFINFSRAKLLAPETSDVAGDEFDGDILRLRAVFLSLHSDVSDRHFNFIG